MPESPPPANHVICCSPEMRPVEPEDLVHALAFALRYQGRKRVHTAIDGVAQITAEWLAEYLREAGFVVMKKPLAPLHGG